MTLGKDAHVEIPDELRDADQLTPYAGALRCGEGNPNLIDRETALKWVTAAVSWARHVVELTAEEQETRQESVYAENHVGVEAPMRLPCCSRANPDRTIRLRRQAMNETSAAEAMLGPVDMVIIGYPPDAPKTGEALPLFVDLIDRGIIRVLDVKGVRRNDDGTFDAFDIGDIDLDGIPDLKVLEGAQTGLIGDEDLRVAVEAMEPGTAALMIVFENSWAAPFVAAVHRNGGRVLAYERIAAEDLLDALDALEA